VAKKQAVIHDLTGRRRGWTPIAVSIDSGAPIVPHLLDLARERFWALKSLHKFAGHVPEGLAVRGALVSNLPDDPIVMALRRRGVPVVRIGTFPNPEDHLVPAVMTDRPAIGRLAAEHFADRGFKHVAYVGREPWQYDFYMYEALAAKAKELGLHCHLRRLDIKKLQSRVTGDQSLWQVRQEDFTRWLVGLPKPVGLLGFADTIADRYTEWALQAGLRVPEEVAILGIGNARLTSESASVPLSSVAADPGQVALAAVRTLAQLMAGQPLETCTVMVPPAGIVTRQSTDVLAASDPDVRRALRFMWDHVAEDLSVDDIARHVGFSRRKLEMTFQRELGRGINTELQRRRLQKAGELIATTGLSMAQVAEAMGYSSPSYFSQVFRAAYDQTPAEYRRSHRHGTPAPSDG